MKRNTRIVALIVAAIIVLASILTILGVYNIGPLQSLSTDCQKGKIKVVDNFPGQKPGLYDYECH